MYKKLTDSSWEEFNKIIENKKLIIWGAGQRCVEKLPLWNVVYNIAYIVDSDNKKWGTTIFGKKIYDPNILLNEENDNLVILICGIYAGSIALSCEDIGINNYFSEFWMDNYTLTKLVRCQKEFPVEKIERVLLYLADERSKEVFSKIIQKRKQGICDYSDIGEGNEYFRDDLFTWTDEEIYIDAGAYDGDSILAFITKNNYFKKIYAFEVDKNNYDLLRRSFSYQAFKKRIKIYNKGVWNKACSINFEIGNKVSSKVAKKEYIQSYNTDIESVECVALDEVIKEPVTFIKMDIEGSEIEALMGAKYLIKKYKPKLAICIYHKNSDLWEIPEYIHSLVPEYKIYIRHHSVLYVDTVLYATL